MDAGKNRKCSLNCDYVSTMSDLPYGDMVCFCNYEYKQYIGFIEDVYHGVEECVHPDHPLNDDELMSDMQDAWADFISTIKETEFYEKFKSLADWINEKVFKLI